MPPATFDEVPYPEALPDELVHPPDFRPFFTLIEDPASGEHHHPSIHYIFSDDDPDFLTSAIVNSQPLRSEQTESTQNQERLVLLDISPDGKDIRDAQSLSPDWQVASTNISQAPSWNETDQSKRDGSLMLTISGIEGQRNNLDGNKERIEHVVVGYQDRLAVLDKLIKRDVVDGPEMEAIVHGQTQMAHGGD